MQRVLSMQRMGEAAPHMDPKTLQYLNEGQIESFESFEEFSLIAFDWYDVHSDRTQNEQMLLYLDREDLFIFCEDDAAEAKASVILKELTAEEPSGNEQMLYRFFARLLKGSSTGICPTWSSWRRTSARGRRPSCPVPTGRTWTASSSGGGSCCG